MAICFVEYRIAPEHKETYLAYTKELIKLTEEDVTIYEGTDQPNLFVEIWTVNSVKDAEHIKKERYCERSSWCRIAEWIPGGSDKMHVWAFKPAFHAD